MSYVSTVRFRRIVRILNTYEAQAHAPAVSARSCLSLLLSIIACRSSRCQPAASDVNKGACHAPHLVLQECVASDPYFNDAAGLQHRRIVNGANAARLALWQGSGEITKVVLADEQAYRGLHLPDIQSFAYVAGEPPCQRRRSPAVQDAVAISTASRMPSRVERRVNDVRFPDRYVLRQVVVHGTDERCGRVGRLRIECDDLPLSMYARIGSSCAPDAHSLACEPLERLFKLGLYRWCVHLILEAAIACAFNILLLTQVASSGLLSLSIQGVFTPP